MKSKVLILICVLVVAFVPTRMSFAQGAGENSIQAMEVAEHGGRLFVRLTMQQPVAAAPSSFTVANPARIVFDFPRTKNMMGRSSQDVGLGDLRSVNIVQAADRARLVLNMLKLPPYEAKVEGNDIVISIAQEGAQSRVATNAGIQAATKYAQQSPAAAAGRNVLDVNFRRGVDGEGRVIVDLSSAEIAVDVRQQGRNLVVDILKANVPEHLKRKADVTDFATPVTSIQTQQQGENARLLITPNGLWEHNAYQSDKQFVLEVKRVVEDPNKLVQGGRGRYQGEKLSLNFQNVDVRSVLQVIADFTNFNIITSDTVRGSVTLRLKDVPWDQALDIILQAKGLDMRKTGNVVWIAPADELASRERQILEAKAQVSDLEPLVTESYQINYHSAKAIFDFLKEKDQTMLSKRGSVVVDERSNRVFVTDVPSRLEALARLITEIDIAPRQVMIEARIVEASKEFARELGVRMNFTDLNPRSLGKGGMIGFGDITADGGGRGTWHNGMQGTGWSTGGGSTGTTSSAFGSLTLSLFNRSLTRVLGLSVDAMETDFKGRVISSPRVLTANQVEASIEQGTEIPYQEASSSGATSTSFKKAVLSLKVKPQITPDGRIQLKVEVNKDSPVFYANYDTPAVDTKNVISEVLVDNGGTVVIGGIYEETDTNATERVPWLGELPVVGALFRSTSRQVDRKELLIFITPRIINEALNI